MHKYFYVYDLVIVMVGWKIPLACQLHVTCVINNYLPAWIKLSLCYVATASTCW